MSDCVLIRMSVCAARLVQGGTKVCVKKPHVSGQVVNIGFNSYYHFPN